MKTEKLIITGPSGAGKDYLLKQMLEFGLAFSPKVTTRPMRPEEQQGREYNFVTNEKFAEMLTADEVKTIQSFNIGDKVWHYAITRESFLEGQLFIMTPTEVSMLSPDERKGCFVVYLCIDEQVRLSRVDKRNDKNDSIARRFSADKKDFEGFSDYDMKVTDPELDPAVIYDLMQ
jgi:guanylate kinase